MTQQEILDSNKLIAEFMLFEKAFIQNCDGVPYDYHLPDIFELIKEVEISIESENGWGLVEQDMCQITDLKFHSSWDWLMPVVEKIENLEFGKWYVHIQGNTVDIEDGNEGIGLWDFHINNEDPVMSLFPSHKNLKPIEAVYIAVTEFIKWYNEQLKENECSTN